MIEIREITTIEDLKEVQVIEKHVWQMDSIPLHQTLTTVKNGGIVVGAYIEGRLVGFSYGFPGFKDGSIYFCSHMLGIDKQFRSKGIGEMLKRKQRELAIAKGYSWMQWTFDPLETRNAYLNLTKLRGICDTYVENCYGKMQDGLNKGLPSDRLEIHWFLKSKHVTKLRDIQIHQPIPVNSIRFMESNLPLFEAGNMDELSEEAYSLSVPKDFQWLKKTSPELAMDWRLNTRKEFNRIFQAGYAAVRLEIADLHANYIFVRKDTLDLEENIHET